MIIKQVLQEKLEGNNSEKEAVEIVVPLKYLSNIWRTLDTQLINCEVALILTWSKNCVITSQTTRDADPVANPAVVELELITQQVKEKITQQDVNKLKSVVKNHRRITSIETIYLMNYY